MKYLLDTNTCIRFLNGRAPNIRIRMRAISDEDIAISTLTMGEMLYGSAKSQTPEISRAKQERFFEQFTQLPFDAYAARAYGPIRAILEKRGTPIGQIDTLIAAIAISQQLILVTHNLREFTRVEGLRIEDWEI
jgi:tRNA(fMet)-specific endonuclease VapC